MNRIRPAPCFAYATSLLGRMSDHRIAGVFGLLSVFLYVAAVILGGFLDPSYSHVRNAISDLTGDGALTASVLNPVFVLYNLLSLCFVFFLSRTGSSSFSLRSGCILYAASACAGILMYHYRADNLDAPLTCVGLGHLILAGVESIATLPGHCASGADLVSSHPFARANALVALLTTLSLCERPSTP